MRVTPKSEMLDAALGYFVAHGLATSSLRPMASAMGTSARMLLFHFESKEGLIRAVLEELHARLRASFLREIGRKEHDDLRAPIRRFWDWATVRKNSEHLRLLYEMQVMAAQSPQEYARYLKGFSSDWQTLALSVLTESVRSRAMATLCIAVFDGLFLEFMLTGDRKRLGEALDQFVALARADNTPNRDPVASSARASCKEIHGNKRRKPLADSAAMAVRQKQ